jgi:hypothetical protein
MVSIRRKNAACSTAESAHIILLWDGFTACDPKGYPRERGRGDALSLSKGGL